MLALRPVRREAASIKTGCYGPMRLIQENYETIPHNTKGWSFLEVSVYTRNGSALICCSEIEPGPQS